MKKYSVGIKYCGGCHSFYDRRKALSEIRASLEDICSFETAAEGRLYDAVLVINGCPSQCADTSRLRSASGFASCSNLVTPQDICKRIKNMLNEKEDDSEA